MKQAPGLPLLLPEYAREDLGYQDLLTGWAGPSAGHTWTYVAGGDYVDVPVVIIFTVLITAAGSFFPSVSAFDADLKMQWSVASPVPHPGGGATFTYTFSCLVSSTVSSSAGTTVTVPFPATALLSGWRMDVAAGNTGAGVVTGQPVATAMRFPTGPAAAGSVDRAGPQLIPL